jgi:predicted O-linked N-acetylglucosamine transferase (SPINDLY family)
LRIGFVSGDLRNHPVGAFLENVLARIDPTRLNLVAYSTSFTEDELSARVKPWFAEWSVVASLTDEVLASKIHSDQIDILVDLAGHTERNRLSVFAWRPAPLQVAWLGYWASTGVSEIDYILADQISVPKSSQQYFCEKTWYLPDTRFCFTPPVIDRVIEVQGLAAQRKGHITFGSFQALNKMSDGSLSAWSRILAVIPSARLRLQNWQLSYPDAKEDMRKRLAAASIDLDRTDLHGGAPRDEYLAAYSEVDIILDTFPFPGGTTTAEALWIGVPTITLTGETLLARQGESMLRCVGLGDWVATTEQEYFDLALVHASDLTRLSELRTGLRSHVLGTPLFDADRFSRHLVEAFAGMRQANAIG